MSNTNLVLHRGARIVGMPELDGIALPEATRTYVPVGHGDVFKASVKALETSGYRVAKTQLSLSRDNAKFFGVIDLSSALSPDGRVTLSVGVRNSIDKSFPMGFCAGSRVFVCDNLAFSAELMVRRKHTRFGERNFHRAIADSVTKLTDFVRQEGLRIDVMKNKTLTDVEAESLLLRAAVNRGILNLDQLGDTVKEYYEPRHDEFRPRTAWSLYNAVTETLKSVKNPESLRARTMRLGAMLAA